MRTWMRLILPLAAVAATLSACGQTLTSPAPTSGMTVQQYSPWSWWPDGAYSPYWYGGGYSPWGWGGGPYGGYGYPGFGSPLFYGGDVLYRQVPYNTQRLIEGTLRGGYALPNFII